MEWIFDDIGTQIIAWIIGAAMGGFVGYKLGIKQTIKQSQAAGNNAHQNQIGAINNVGK